MSFFNASMPRPNPNFDDKDFWNFCKQKELRFQTCAVCEMARHPPTPLCPHCHSFNTIWKKSSGQARVYTYTVIHHASHEAVTANLPYVVAVVIFDDIPNVRLVTNITEIDPKDVQIGMPLEVWWDAIEDGMHLPRFRAVKGKI